MKIITIPCHFDNYSYLLVCEESGEAAVVDPAEYYPVLTTVEKLQVKLQTVFCTHHHTDHIGGLEDLRAEYPGLKVYGHISDSGRILGLDNPVADGDSIGFGQIEGKVLHTPGHTSGSICFYFQDNLFTGDTVFGAGCGRVFEGSLEQMHQSLMKLVSEIPMATKIFFGHEYTLQNLKFAEFIEPANRDISDRISTGQGKRDRDEPTTPSTLKEELLTNPFLRCDQDEVKQSVMEKLFVKSTNAVDVFAALRKQKDSF